jgi:hypothetical protein
MDTEKVVSFLEKKRDELIELENKHHEEGYRELTPIIDSIKMVIRRIYPNPDVVEKKLFPPPIFMVTESTPDSYFQDGYIDDIHQAKKAIDTILEEKELFGFEDFTPEKIKKETEWQLGSEKIGGFFRKKKTE